MNKIDQLAWQANFGSEDEQNQAYLKIWNLAQEKGIQPASINDLYLARGGEKTPVDFTVPAMNLRGMAYDMAQAVFQVATAKGVGAMIFEIARSEMGYTKQSPWQYVATVLAAGLKTGFQGPVFIQGDHFQLKQGEKPGKYKPGEMSKVKALVKDSVEAGFYNIDIDASTLVDYSEARVKEQQIENIKTTVELAELVRDIQPKGIEVSLGGEIGHIGGKNSTEEELRAYMDGFLSRFGSKRVGLSKVSIQTGTHHGGVVLPDGSLAKVSVDFSVLEKLARVCRDYGMGGTVQHGASTLPDDFFAQFPASEAVEVHLATGFQNIMMDHPKFPKKLLDKMYKWLDENKTDERKPEQTDEQFYYKLRKKTWGEFKKESWEIDEARKKKIREALMNRFDFMFDKLNVFETKNLVNKWIKPQRIEKKEVETNVSVDLSDDKGLAD